jgi:hypothetical protein
VNAIVNEDHKIDLDVCRSGGDWGKLSEYAQYREYDFQDWADNVSTFIDDPQEKAEELANIEAIKQTVASLKKTGAGNGPLVLYCNTTGGWCKSTLASETKDKWDKAFMYQVGSWWKCTLRWQAASPFRTYEYKGKKNFEKPVATTSWEDSYLNTAQVNALLSKLPENTSLKSELEDVGLKTAKYLVSSERFDNTNRQFYYDNDWYFDTFEVSKSTSADKGFTKDKKHYDASNRLAVATYVKHINWKTDSADMFVLQKTTVSTGS